MTVEALGARHIEAVMDLLCGCFQEDHYYARLFPDPVSRGARMRQAFLPAISYCLENGCCFGVWEKEALIAFVLCFDYHALREGDPGTFEMIFTGERNCHALPYQEEIHGRIRALPSPVLYCLSIAVREDFRHRNIGSGLVDRVLAAFPEHSVAADVSNDGSLEIYRRRGFSVEPIAPGYHLVSLRPGPPAPCPIGETVPVAVPETAFLARAEIPFRPVKEEAAVFGARAVTDHGVPCFRREENAVCLGALVELDYPALLAYQRLLNVAQYDEAAGADFVCYVQREPYRTAPLMNDTLAAMTPARTAEWSIIPDVFVSVPVQYSSRKFLLSQCVTVEGKPRALLDALDFRTYYEAGVPSSMEDVDDLASFKKRIERYCLGRLSVQIVSEPSMERYDEDCQPIGAPALVDIYISIDNESSCAVLTWYALSAPFLLSHLMDNIIRNGLSVVLDGGQSMNFYDYVAHRFGLIKRGTPKIFSVIPRDRDCLRPGQLASLLSGETIYPEGENFGEIIDPEIVSLVNSESGMGQYDRAFVYAYTNVVLQFSPELRGTLRERLCEGSITLFYIELILLEEAAIHTADREINQLFTSDLLSRPIAFLTRVGKIYDDYSRTMDFWDIQVNYPTSQKSISMLREAFKIKEQLEYMQRNQDQLQMVFDTKCDIIDRNDANRMNTSLAVISLLAVFSAWIDGYDYLSTWGDVLSPTVIHILQRVLFAVILVIAGYAVAHLFGNRLRTYLRRRRPRGRRKKDRDV